MSFITILSLTMVDIFKHKVSYKTTLRFLALLSVLVGYFIFLSWKYDIVTGGVVSGLTWSFFVLCTPVADAGFLLDFPFRLIANIKMFISELIVWGVAISLNIWVLFFHVDFYEKTGLTQLLHRILTTPWPYWSIIVLSALGTFLSVWFGDKIMDSFQSKDNTKRAKKTRIIHIALILGLFAVIFFVYYDLIKNLGIDLSHFE